MNSFEIKPLLIEAGLAVLLVAVVVATPYVARRVTLNFKRTMKQVRQAVRTASRGEFNFENDLFQSTRG